MGVSFLDEARILVADDDKNMVTKIRGILEANGCQNVTSKFRISSLRELENYEVVVLDIVWRGNTKPKYQTDDYFGISAAKYLREHSPDSCVILMSKYFYELDHSKEIAKTCDDFFNSNGDSTKILSTIIKSATSKAKSSPKGDVLKEALLIKQILEEVNGYVDNKPSLVGLGNDTHATLLEAIDAILTYCNQTVHPEPNSNISKQVDKLSQSLKKDYGTVSKSFSELVSQLVQSVSAQNASTRVDPSNVYFIGEVKMSSNDGDTYNVNQAGAVGKYARSDSNTFVCSAKERTLAEAAKEIQDLLKNLEETNPGATEDEKIVYINDKTTHSFKSRVAGALQSSGEAVIDEFVLENKYLKVAKAAIKGWLQPGS